VIEENLRERLELLSFAGSWLGKGRIWGWVLRNVEDILDASSDEVGGGGDGNVDIMLTRSKSVRDVLLLSAGPNPGATKAAGVEGGTNVSAVDAMSLQELGRGESLELRVEDRADGGRRCGWNTWCWGQGARRREEQWQDTCCW
jgi:hypothetical protein